MSGSVLSIILEYYIHVTSQYIYFYIGRIGNQSSEHQYSQVISSMNARSCSLTNPLSERPLQHGLYSGLCPNVYLILLPRTFTIAK